MRILDTLIPPVRGISTHNFDVPKGTGSLRIEVTGQEIGYGFVLAQDPKGRVIADILLGMGSCPRLAFVSQETATVNAARGPILPGRHQLLAAFPCSGEPPDSLAVHVDADCPEAPAPPGELQEDSWFSPGETLYDYGKLARPEARWYKGDLHTHTTLSDGAQTIAQAGRTAIARRLDYIALTDHNRAAYGVPDLELLTLPSFELTLPKGHFNIHGLRRPVFNPQTLRLLRTAASEEELLDGLLDLYASESNRSLNHPFMAPWELRDETLDISRIDTIEVICDPTFRDAPAANDRAAAFVDYLWQEGFRVYGVGGSDSHLLPGEKYPDSSFPSIYGDPATFVYCEGLSGGRLLDAVSRGRCYISRFAVLDISIHGGRIFPGDRIPDNIDAVEYTVTVRDCPAGWKAFYIVDGRRVSEALSPGADVRLSLAVRARNCAWARFGLEDAAGHVAAYVNPVYWGERTRRNGRILELVRDMDANQGGRQETLIHG